MNLIKRIVVSAAFCLLIFILAQCDSTEPPIEAHGLVLRLEDVSCTEAWIELSTINLQLPATITLKQNNQTKKIISLVNPDSLLFINSLLPNTNYTFQSFAQQINQNEVTSNELSVTTMDTTSHDFTFQTWMFGEHGNSVLYDVAIINENNIIAVGEIYMNDSLGIPDPNAYNAIHWDGSQWELKRINMLSSCNPVTYPPLKAIWAFSESNIVITSGGSVGWFDGVTNVPDCSIRPLLTGAINKLWGSSSSNLYVVGNGGNIAWYNGSQWTKIESGTDVDLRDVWATSDGSIVWVSGKVDLSKTVLIKIEGGQTNIVFEDQYPWQIQEGRISGGISSIWTNNKNFLYITTPITAYRCLSSTSGEGKEIYPFDDYLNGGTIRIRGNSGNDIITSGSNCSILHYNGISWKRYEQFTDINTKLWSSDIKRNTLAAVGDRVENLFYYKAIIIVGRR